MNKKKFVKIIIKLFFGFILVIYLTASGIVLGFNTVKAYGVNNIKYTIDDEIKLKLGLDEFARKEYSNNFNCLYFVTSIKNLV